MRHQFTLSIAIGLVVAVVSASTINAQQGKPADIPGDKKSSTDEVSFPSVNLKIVVPAGWKVTEDRTKNDPPSCVLQKRDGEKVLATVAVWAGKKFVETAVKEVAPKLEPKDAASVWVHDKVLGLMGKKPGGPFKFEYEVLGQTKDGKAWVGYVVKSTTEPVTVVAGYFEPARGDPLVVCWGFSGDGKDAATGFAKDIVRKAMKKE